MKILLLGEYSNLHWTLARGLRQLGHEVTVASNGDFWKDYPRDIDFARQPGKWGGIKLMARIYSNLSRLRGYDIVQIINPVFFELRAERLFPIYRYLRRHNGKMVLGAFGMDYYWVSVNTNERPLRYSDFNIGQQLRTDAPAVKEQADWTGTAKERLNCMIADDCDAIVTGLYEYQAIYAPKFPSKTHYIPLPIDMPTEECCTDRAQSSKVVVFIGISRGRSEYKGTDIMLRAAEDLRLRYAHCMKLVVAEGVPFEQYRRMMDGSDAILDQLYSYTPSMNSLLAMSKGIICIGGGEPECYDILGERELRPIVNVEPKYESVYHELEQLITHPDRIPELKRQSIEFVKRHHDFMKVARQYEALYETL